MTAGGRIDAPVYRIQHVTLGDQVFNDIDFAVLAAPQSGAEGVLGMNVLGQIQFEIDQSTSQLLVKDRQQLGLH